MIATYALNNGVLNSFRRVAQATGMSKRKQNKMIEDIFEKCVSANECTGLFQKVLLDPNEVKKFHEMYNNIDGKDSVE